MADYQNFQREYRFAAGQAGKKGFEIGKRTATSPVPLHISFAVQKNDSESSNTGKVTIWNLNKAHMSELSKKNCIVSVKAGYQQHLSLIFEGVVSMVTTARDGADVKTEIEVVDSLVEKRDTYVSVSYKGMVNWKDIFNDVAAQMGVAVVYSYNAKFSNVNNGYTFVGKGKDIITKGCNCCGLTWSLQNGVLQIKKRNDSMSLNAYLLSPKTGLLGTPIRVVVSKDDKTGKNQMGWDVEYFLNGAIGIDDYIKLESSAVKGYFRVKSVEMQGDNVSGDWIAKARLLEA